MWEVEWVGRNMFTHKRGFKNHYCRYNLSKDCRYEIQKASKSSDVYDGLLWEFESPLF